MHNNISDAESFFETASKEELIDYLVKTIEKEVSKGDDADCDLVRECSDWLDELTEDEVTFTPEELERKLAQLKAGSESKKPVKICKKAKLKTFVRVALIAAVIFTISLVSLSAVAVNKGYGSAWEYIVTNINRISGLENGETLSEHGITIVKNSGTYFYKNMEDLLNCENINIMYPYYLPNNGVINTIYQTIEDDNKYILSFDFSDETYSLDVANYYSINPEHLKQIDMIIVNGIEYYIVQKDYAWWHATCQYNGYEYTINCKNYDNLIQIINSMRG